MKTKNALIFLGGACAGVSALLFGRWLLNGQSNYYAGQLASGTTNISRPIARVIQVSGSVTNPAPAKPLLQSRAERALLSSDERLRWLEANGEVPADADDLDWTLAQRTSWWGKPLDPKEFWKGRVLWCDDAAKAAAGRRGHVWPPIPENAPEVWRNGRLGSNGLRADSNWRVTAFWGEFIRTHPKPPEHLEISQSQLAGVTLEGPKILERMSRPSRVTAEILARSDEFSIKQLVKEGYPPEAFSAEALFWSYALQRRQEYQKLITEGHLPDSLAVKGFLDRSAVDTQLITSPLSDEQRVAANAWKVSYLRRLREEQTDESYINAYLKAWNLSPAEAFSKQKP